LIFLLDTRRRPRPSLKSPHGGPLAGPPRANTRQHPGPEWANEAPSLGGRYSVPTRGDMWKQKTLGSPWLGHQSGSANACHSENDKQVASNDAKYKQRKIESHNRQHQRPRYPGTRRPITGRHLGHDPPAPWGQHKAHDSRPAPIESDPQGHVSHPRCCSATCRPQPPHMACRWCAAATCGCANPL